MESSLATLQPALLTADRTERKPRRNTPTKNHITIANGNAHDAIAEEIGSILGVVVLRCIVVKLVVVLVVLVGVGSTKTEVGVVGKAPKTEKKAGDVAKKGDVASASETTKTEILAAVLEDGIAVSTDAVAGDVAELGVPSVIPNQLKEENIASHAGEIPLNSSY